MIRIEVIGLDPPCKKGTERLENVQAAVSEAGIAATVEKKWTLSREIRDQYGPLLSPALVVEGVVVAQRKFFKTDRIVDLIL